MKRTSPSKKIVLLDFCSEKNRGDAAMQIGLISLVKKYFPKNNLRIITVFGANQKKYLKRELDHTAHQGIPIMGGLKHTFYPLGKKQWPILMAELLNTALSFYSLIILLLIKLSIPLSLTELFLPVKFRPTLRSLSEADLVIWRGRNFRNRKNSLLEIYRSYNLVYHALICVLLKKRVVCLGASLWPLKSHLSRLLLRYVLSRCLFISVREDSSYQEMKRLVGRDQQEKIRLLPDLAFAALRTTGVRTPVKGFSKKLPTNIGLTLVDWKSDGKKTRDEYKTSIETCLKKLIADGCSITVIPQVTKSWESSSGLYEEIRACLSSSEKRRLNIAPQNLSVTDLIDTYKRLDLLIATRMHSAIFALFAGTPVVAIAYDSGGKWSILEKLGIKKYILNYNRITSQKLTEKINRCWDNRIKTGEKIRKDIDLHLAEVNLNMSLVKSKINQLKV